MVTVYSLFSLATEEGLSTNFTSATSDKATEPPFPVVRTMPRTWSMLLYSSSAYCTFTSISSPFTWMVVAFTPSIQLLTAVAIWDGVRPADFAFKASTLTSTTGDEFSTSEWIFVTSSLVFNSSTTELVTSFTSS